MSASVSPGGSGASSEWAEVLLRDWTANWAEVSDLAGADWEGDPYEPEDFENARCIWRTAYRQDLEL